MCFELLCTNILVVCKIGKVLFSTKFYFLQMRNKTFCSVKKVYKAVEDFPREHVKKCCSSVKMLVGSSKRVNQ